MADSHCLKLDPARSQMLIELREWLTSQEIVEFAGSKVSGFEASKTSTTVARWLLESAIDALYADRLLDGLIDVAADLWAEDPYTSDKIFRSEDGYPKEEVNELFVQRILQDEGLVSGLPADLILKLVMEGKARWKKRGSKAKLRGPVSGELLAARFKERYGDLQETEKTSDKIELY